MTSSDFTLHFNLLNYNCFNVIERCTFQFKTKLNFTWVLITCYHEHFGIFRVSLKYCIGLFYLVSILARWSNGPHWPRMTLKQTKLILPGSNIKCSRKEIFVLIAYPKQIFKNSQTAIIRNLIFVCFTL